MNIKIIALFFVTLCICCMASSLDLRTALKSASSGKITPVISGNKYGGTASIGVPVYNSNNIGVGVSVGKSGSWRSRGINGGVGIKWRF